MVLKPILDFFWCILYKAPLCFRSNIIQPFQCSWASLRGLTGSREWCQIFTSNLSLLCCSMYSHEQRISGSEEYWFGQLWPFIWLRRQLCSGWVAVASVFCERGALTDRHCWLELTWRRDVCQCTDCSSHRAPKDGHSHRHAATTAPRWVSPWLNLPSNTGWVGATWCVRVCVLPSFQVCVCMWECVCGCTRVPQCPGCIAIVFTSDSLLHPLISHSSPTHLCAPASPVNLLSKQNNRLQWQLHKCWAGMATIRSVPCFWGENDSFCICFVLTYRSHKRNWKQVTEGLQVFPSNCLSKWSFFFFVLCCHVPVASQPLECISLTLLQSSWN